MTTFQQTPVKSELAGDERLSDYALGYLNQRVRNSFYDYVMRRFEEASKKEGLTKSILADRIGVTPSRVTRLLGSPSNWTLDTVSTLLIGICRAELLPASEPYLGRAKRNRQPEDFLQLGETASSVELIRVQTSPMSPISHFESSREQSQDQVQRLPNIPV